VLQRVERMLPGFDPDLVGWLMDKFAELGIDVRLRSEVKQIDKRAGGFTVHATTNGQRLKVTADLVVHAAGREPDLEALDLAAGSIATENGRVKLNEFLQSVSNPRCQSAPKFDPASASNFDPFERRGLTVALGSSELAGIAETRRARVA